MNSMQRRLFRAFAEAGGDLSEDAQVEGFIRYVESNLVLLPPRVREAVELVWRGRDPMSYADIASQLAQRERAALSVGALQQRVSRGTRLLEDAVRTRSWGSPAAARPGSGGPRR